MTTNAEKSLLIISTGTTDVQLVTDEKRVRFQKDVINEVHKNILKRLDDCSFVETPTEQLRPDASKLPKHRPIQLCTPKLDAALAYVDENDLSLCDVLVLCTSRETFRQDPIAAGAVLCKRLAERLSIEVEPVVYLKGREHLEDGDRPQDAIVRRSVAAVIDEAIREKIDSLNPAQVLVAASGGIPEIARLVPHIVRLRAGPQCTVTPLHIAEPMKGAPERAVRRDIVPGPQVSFETRRIALDLIRNGHVVGAWGAVRHLHENPTESIESQERPWTRVIEWMYRWASSLPLRREECDIELLQHERAAVHAALRVELSLRAADIPRAIHGTVAFFEAALWDHLLGTEELPGPAKRFVDPRDASRRAYTLNPVPPDCLVSTSRKDRLPFERNGKEGLYYTIRDGSVSGRRIAEKYLKKYKLAELGVLCDDHVRDLRNDVAHSIPDPNRIEEATKRMQAHALWSGDTPPGFLHGLVLDVLKELEVDGGDRLADTLIEEVQQRLLEFDVAGG